MQKSKTANHHIADVDKDNDAQCKKMNEACKDTLISLLGIKFLVVNEEETVAEMKVTQQHCQPMGLLHGGASITLAESIAGAGSMRMCKKGEMAVGIQLSANHIKSAKKGETVIGVGKLIQQGQCTHLWDIKILNNNNELVSIVRVVNQIIKKK